MESLHKAVGLNKHWQSIGLASLLSFVSVFSHPLLGAEQGLDVAIIMDTSGSMNKNDPGRLRIEAAKLFVALLGRDDRVALISFSGRAYPVTRFLSLNERKNEQKILNSIDKLVANGKYTNLHDALLRGYELLHRKSQFNRAKHIVLLSDGKMDVGNAERNSELLEKTLDELIPKLARENIKVHTIAFTKHAYIPLLKLAAQDTQGQFMFLENPKGIHQVFENLFERTKTPDMIVLSEDSFVLDKGIQELTLVATKFKPYSTIGLEDPDGNEIKESHHDNSVNWFASRQFDLISIKNPAQGYWLVKYSEGGNKVYVVSDFKLNASTTKKNAEPGSPLQIQAYLSKNGHKINRKSLLKTTEFKAKVTSPSGAVIENLLVDDGSEIGSERNDGIYGISYAFDMEGTYKVDVTATGQTFDRKKVLFVDVRSTNPSMPFFTKAKENKKSLAELIKQQAHESEPTPKDTPSTESQTTETEQAKTHDAPPSETSDNNPGNIPSPVEHEEPLPKQSLVQDEKENASADTIPLGDAFFAFIMFNVILGSLGGAYYYYFKRKQNKAFRERSKEDNSLDTPEQTQGKPIEPTVTNSAEEFGGMSEDTEEIDLDIEESISSVLSDIDLDEDLETELSSILETEMSKLK
ncbi:MAG TPA: VWA domain-containing protein [Gammaproteobacteria bacterium]|nr:VWA domain-containing protein [Gammaproteobacteria bacterium]